MTFTAATFILREKGNMPGRNAYVRSERHGNSGPLKITLIIVLVVLIAEVIGGFVSNSLALLGDAGHMLTDALALVLSLLAVNLARRPATGHHTYGYHRAEIIAALANGVILVVISIWIFYEAYLRFQEPRNIDPPIMLAVAGVGLIANLAGMFILHRSAQRNINIKAAFWHITGDTLSSVGVIIAGFIIMITGWSIVDPILAVVIGCVIIWSAFRIVKEAGDILLESVPGHISLDEVLDAVASVPGVNGIHDIHIWTITSGIYALSAHVDIDDCMVSESTAVVGSINTLLSGRFGINHTTLQLECENCSNGSVCNLPGGMYDDH